jgi:aminotransferase
MSERYLARHVAGLKPSGIRKFFDIVATMHDVISLGIGEPDFVTPDSIVQAGIRSLQSGDTHYTSNPGRIELRQAVSAHLSRLHGVEYDPASEVIITVGVSEALYLSMTALLNPGEEVIIPTPCFVSYQAEVILAGGVPSGSAHLRRRRLRGPGRSPGSCHYPPHQSHPDRVSE